FLQRIQPIQKRLIVLPDCSLVEFLRRHPREFTDSQSLLFCLCRYLCIVIGRYQTGMSQPSPNDIHLDARLKQIPRLRVTKQVRADMPWMGAAGIEMTTVSAHYFVNARPG